MARRRRFRIDTEVRCVGAHPPLALCAGEGSTQLSQYMTQIGRMAGSI